jgi:hypothetical protein
MGSDMASIAQIQQDDTSWTTVDISPGKDDRNYATFAVLGFLGRYEGFDVLYPDRGIPKDLLPLVKTENRGYSVPIPAELFYIDDEDDLIQEAYLGCYQLSHLTLRELETIQQHYYEKRKDEYIYPLERLWLLDDIIKALNVLAMKYERLPSQIRLVFGFD